MKNFLFLLLVLIVGGSYSQTDYYLKPGGTITTLADWGDQPDGTGTAPADFTSSDNWNITDNNPSITLSAAWNVDNAATINVGDAVAACTLVIGSGGSIPNGPFINVLDLATFDIQTNFAFVSSANVSPQTGSTFVYSNGVQPIAALGTDFYNLIIASNVSLNTTNISVDGTLTINSSFALILNGRQITVGSLAGSGVINGGTASSNAGVTVNGAGGTLNTSPGSRLWRLNVNLLNNSDVLVLGSDLRIDLGISPTFALTRGILSIGARTFSNNGQSTFNANGSIAGTSSSTLIFTGALACTGSMLMAPTSNSLGVLTFSRSGRTLSLGNTLNIIDRVDVNAGTLASGSGNLFIRSNASNKGRIGEVGGAITGNIRVETFALGGTTGWTNLGCSGVNGRNVSSWDGQIPMTCAGCINGLNGAGGTAFTSIQGWDPLAAANDPAAYTALTNTDPLNPGTGVWVYLGNGISSTGDMTWTVTGPATQGDRPVALSAAGTNTAGGDGFNLIANPYASPISWNAALADNSGANVTSSIYAYNPDIGAVSFNGVISSPSGSGELSDVIAMGQGFYVQKTVTAASSFTFRESHKVASNTPLLKTNQAENSGSVIRLAVNGAGGKDNTAIFFHPDATTNFDSKWDAWKLYAAPGVSGTGSNQRTTISTKMGSDDYSINSLPLAITQDAIIPVLVKVNATGQHTISGTDLQNLPNSCIILKDKLLNTSQDLKAGPYVCNISNTETSTRFELRVCADPAMAIDKKSFVDQSVFIGQDMNGVYVKFNFDKSTPTSISVTNILGQTVVENKNLTADKDVVYINVPEKQQLLFVTVSTETQKVTKKIVR
jgi:hypothetical protein